MRIKSSYLVAAAIVAVVMLYLVVRPFLGRGHGDEAAAHPTQPANAIPLVQVAVTPESQHPYRVALRGRTQAARSVVVRSETSGVVAQTPVLQGTMVGAGTVLCRLSVDARQAAVDQAKAMWKSRQLQMQASSNLAAKGFRSPTQVLSDQANLDQAQAAVRQAEVALAQVNIRAPFAGVFDHRDAEVGAYLSPGQPCGTMIELDPLLIVGDIPETETGKVKVGAAATARLVSGETITGHIRFVARDADPTTRTYHLEITAPNPGARVRSGLSADIDLDAGVGPAHLVPTPALVLDAAGRQGVRYVTADGTVAFAPVSVLEETPQGIWVSGLRGTVRVITVGQSYVSEGQKVRVASR
ncbi:MAG TPA: efflux RND transporter periplasmic adaptor subunit [Caulobacteraceae bacterium]|nr:efflux RND transporter periplasmic adaptor subunit [Caulobacteraceae bacterium]